MNAAITNTGTRTWKLVKAQYLGAALGAALALSAVVGIDNVKNVDFGGSSGRVTAPVASTFQSPAAKQGTIYIVGSQAQADQIIANESEVGSARQVGVWLVDTLDKEFALSTGMSEAAQAGSNTQFVDLRGR